MAGECRLPTGKTVRQRRCSVGWQWLTAAVLLLPLQAHANAQDDTCWQAVIRNERTAVEQWNCAARALPVGVPGHAAHRLKPLVIASADDLWIVDPGATYAQGIDLLKALTARYGNAQRLWVINSRAQAEHVMASDALLSQPGRREIRQISLPETHRLMKQRCTPCRQRLERELGKAAMKNTRIRVPEARVAARWPLSNVITVHAQADAAIEEDTWIQANDLTWVWVGTLLSDNMPDLQQGRVESRIRFLKHVQVLAQQHPDIVWLTSTGRSSAAVIDREFKYFEGWFREALRLLEDGKTSLETLQQLREQPLEKTLYGDRLTADQAQLHDLNLQRIIRQAEEALFR